MRRRGYGKVEKTCIKGLGFCVMNRGRVQCCLVDVEQDKIVRIRPFHFDWRYRPEEIKPWQIQLAERNSNLA